MIIPQYHTFSDLELQMAHSQARCAMNSTYGRELSVPYQRYAIGAALCALIRAEQEKRKCDG